MAHKCTHKYTRSSIALSSANKGKEHAAATRTNIASHVRVLQSDVRRDWTSRDIRGIFFKRDNIKIK